MPKRNEPTGEVECPQKGCTDMCKVFGFQPRTQGRRSVFTGKLYLVCPKHGRIGADGSQAVTDYILEKGTIWGAKKPENTAGNPQKQTNGQSGAAARESPKNPQPNPHPNSHRNPKPSPKTPDPDPQSKPKGKDSLWSPPW